MFHWFQQKIKIKKISGKGKRACVKDLIFIVPFLRLAKRGVCVWQKRGVWRSSRAWIRYGKTKKVDQVEKASVTSSSSYSSLLWFSAFKQLPRSLFFYLHSIPIQMGAAEAASLFCFEMAVRASGVWNLSIWEIVVGNGLPYSAFLKNA